MRAVVTGGRGFVGQHLTAHLQSLGDDVAVLDRNGADAVDIVDADAVAAMDREGPPRASSTTSRRAATSARRGTTRRPCNG